jgi:hypothetical protein
MFEQWYIQNIQKKNSKSCIIFPSYLNIVLSFFKSPLRSSMSALTDSQQLIQSTISRREELLFLSSDKEFLFFNFERNYLTNTYSKKMVDESHMVVKAGICTICHFSCCLRCLNLSFCSMCHQMAISSSKFWALNWRPIRNRWGVF